MFRLSRDDSERLCYFLETEATKKWYSKYRILGLEDPWGDCPTDELFDLSGLKYIGTYYTLEEVREAVKTEEVLRELER